MGHAISFPCASVAGQRQNRGLSKEVHGRGVPVQVSEDRSKFFARVQFLCGRRIFSVQKHHEVGVCGKERHLTLCIATICTMRVGLDKLPDGEAICGFFR
jgi:hypothetical protein